MKTNYELTLALEEQNKYLEDLNKQIEQIQKQLEWLLEKKEIDKKYKIVEK